MEGVGSGGREKGGGVVDTYVQHLVVPEFQGGGGAEKIQVLRHFQHFPASACASKRVLLQGFEPPQSEDFEDSGRISYGL